VAEDNAKNKKRRIIRKTETVREKAEKSANAAKEPKERGVFSLTLYYITLPLRWIGRGLMRLERIKIFRIIGLVLVPPYFRNSFKELKQVTWPGRKETIRLTFAVLMFAVVFGVFITAVDYGLDKIFKRILLNE
jgi:preprotein translocase SecE subunit